jgi:methionyl-tRNA synthetase
VNKDLADVLGNFVSRVTKFCRSKFGEIVPEGGEDIPVDADALEEFAEKLRAYEAAMDAIEIRRAAAALRALWVWGNEYLQKAAPWSGIKEDEARAAGQIRFALNLIRVYAVLSAPFIPMASARMLSSMNTLDMDWPGDLRAALTALPAGHAFAVPDNLFRKIGDEEREDWQARFAGTRD